MLTTTKKREVNNPPYVQTTIEALLIYSTPFTEQSGTVGFLGKIFFGINKTDKKTQAYYILNFTSHEGLRRQSVWGLMMTK